MKGRIIISEENCDMEQINQAVMCIDKKGADLKGANVDNEDKKESGTTGTDKTAEKSKTNLKTQFKEFIAYEYGYVEEAY